MSGNLNYVEKKIIPTEENTFVPAISNETTVIC